MRGRDENQLTSTDKIFRFHSTVQLWRQSVESANLEMFPHTQKWEEVNSAAMCETVVKHLQTLEQKLCCYFPQIAWTGFGTHTAQL